MLVVVSQGRVSRGYELELTDKTRLHIHKISPSQAELDNSLIEYERYILDAINIGGDDGSITPVWVDPTDLNLGL